MFAYLFFLSLTFFLNSFVATGQILILSIGEFHEEEVSPTLAGVETGGHMGLGQGRVEDAPPP